MNRILWVLFVLFLLATAGWTVFGCMFSAGMSASSDHITWGHIYVEILPGAALLGFLTALPLLGLYLVLKWLMR